jgi:SAM-dependent methyltransferase
MFKFTDKTYLNVLIVISGIMVIRFIAGIVFPKEDDDSDDNKYEGFEQSVPFVLNVNDAVWNDPFYIQLYDDIYIPSTIANTDISYIKKTTKPNMEHSCFLEIGSGTGGLLQQLHSKGFRVFGVDKSQVIVDYSQDKYPDIPVKCDNVYDPMAFEYGYFTHIICNNFTIYHFEKKRMLFQNIFHWLAPGGYLVLHVVDPDKFDTIIPAGKPTIINTPQKYSKFRITETALDFKTFKYKAKYIFPNNQVMLTETFTDEKNQHVRQYEQVLFMETKETILLIAEQCGFSVYSQSNYSDINNGNGDMFQHLIILKRPA